MVFDNPEPLTNQDGLTSLVSIGGLLEISRFANITHLDGLSGLTSIGKGIKDYFNPTLTNVDGLGKLTTVGSADSAGTIVIVDNTALNSVQGLQNVSSPLRALSISGNSDLTSLQGLESLSSVEKLEIKNNANLCTDVAVELADRLAANNHEMTTDIQSNKDCSAAAP